MHKQLMLRYMTFSCTRADSWCNVIRNYKIFSPTSVDAWCYVTRSSLVLAQTVDVTRSFFSTRTNSWCNVNISYTIFSPTSIDAWCYVTRSCLVLAQTLHVAFQDLLFYMCGHLMVSEGVFSCSCTLAQTLGLGARLKNTWRYVTGCWATRGVPPSGWVAGG